MTNSNVSNRASCAILLTSLLAFTACKSDMNAETPPVPENHRAEISNEITAAAQVVGIDPTQRLVSLRREDGTVFTLEVGSGVRNFGQVKVGDELSVRYRETLAASLLPKDSGVGMAEGAFAAGRAEPGSKPGAGMALAISFPVEIESIDLDNDIVVFSLASGELIARRLQTDAGRTFVKGLELGDRVQLEFTEAVALGIETP
jgi:hypothetical protein